MLTGENWNEVLYDGMKVAGFNSVLFFLLLTFIGNYVIFNLFLAILLDQFDQNEDDDNDDAKNARGGSKVTPKSTEQHAKTSKARSPKPVDESKPRSVGCSSPSKN